MTIVKLDEPVLAFSDESDPAAPRQVFTLLPTGITKKVDAWWMDGVEPDGDDPRPS